MSEKQINKNIPQVVSYNNGKKEIAKAIRAEDPSVTRRGARRAAAEIAAEADPTKVREAGYKRIGRRAVAGAAIVAGSVAGLALMDNAFDRSPSFQPPTEESQETPTTVHIDVKGGDPSEGTRIYVTQNGQGE